MRGKDTSLIELIGDVGITPAYAGKRDISNNCGRYV